MTEERGFHNVQLMESWIRISKLPRMLIIVTFKLITSDSGITMKRCTALEQTLGRHRWWWDKRKLRNLSFVKEHRTRVEITLSESRCKLQKPFMKHSMSVWSSLSWSSVKFIRTCNVFECRKERLQRMFADERQLCSRMNDVFMGRTLFCSLRRPPIIVRFFKSLWRLFNLSF